MEIAHLEFFGYGLAVGVFLALIVYIRERYKKGKLEKKIKKLKGHLSDKLELDAEAAEIRKKDLARLQKENENLRITNQSLAQKPGQREITQLHVYQRAIALMEEQLVGFAPIWQKSLKTAEEEMEQVRQGSVPFYKKIIPLQFFNSPSQQEELPGTKED
jgi:hypothetical protein